MNREETLALYVRGREVWNEWANEMLTERKRLEEEGEWDAKREEWTAKACSNFSSDNEPQIFQYAVNFEYFIFPADVNFHSAKFDNVANFHFATFNGVAWFINVTFNCDAVFHGVSFETLAFLFGTTFNGHAGFHSTTFKDLAGFHSASFKRTAGFISATFCGTAQFHAVRAEHAFSLSESHFERVPDFIQAHFVEAPRLDNLTIAPDAEPGGFCNSIGNPINPDAKARYQALKRLAIQAHDTENELKFLAGEMRSSRSLKVRLKYKDEKGEEKEKEVWKFRGRLTPAWVFNILYQVFSDFGRSLARPFLFWLFGIALMFAAHFYVHNRYATDDPVNGKIMAGQSCEPLFAAAHLATENGLVVFGSDSSFTATQDYICLYGINNSLAEKFRPLPVIPKWIVFWSTIHTLFSAVMIFLFLLALRNTFKIK